MIARDRTLTSRALPPPGKGLAVGFGEGSALDVGRGEGARVAVRRSISAAACSVQVGLWYNFFSGRYCNFRYL